MTQTSTLRFNDDRTKLVLNVPLTHNALCEVIPSAKYNGVDRAWYLSPTWSSAHAIAAVLKDVDIANDVKEYFATYMQTIVNPLFAARQAMDLKEMDGDLDRYIVKVAQMHEPDRDYNLYHFQECGAVYIASALEKIGACGLFDPMGTGKTAQAITSLHLVDNPFPALIVCPNSVKASWLTEIVKWSWGISAIDLGNNANTRKKNVEAIAAGEYQVGIINWEGLARNSRLAPFGSGKATKSDNTPGILNSVPWRTIIADEAHRAKNPTAKQTRALKALGKDAAYRLALTGTPMANSPVDFWALMNFLLPQEFPSKTKFLDMYCTFNFGDFGGMEVTGWKPESINAFNQSTQYLWRRTPREAALDLPPKVQIARYVEMPAQQKKMYTQMAETYIAETPSGEDVIAQNHIVKLIRMIQFASASCDVNDDGTVVMRTPSSKVTALLEILDDLPEDEKLVVFAHSRKLIDLCAAELGKHNYTFGLITGGQSVDERAVSVQNFQTRKNPRVMLCTIQAGGTGITLTAASTLVFLQKSFSMIDTMQAEDRVYRIGSERHDVVNIINVMSENTIDTHVTEIASMKTEALNELFSDKERLAQILGVK